jgi:hypothetical protein
MSQTVLTLVYAFVFCGVCAGLIFCLRGGLSARARAILLGLVAEAEVLFGAGTGEIKFSAVLSRLYAAMPSVLQFLFSEKTVASWIEDAVAALKACLGEEESA